LINRLPYILRKLIKMAYYSKGQASIALFLSLNLLFFTTFSTGQGSQCPDDIFNQLATCTGNLLTGTTGANPGDCCPIIEPLPLGIVPQCLCSLIEDNIRNPLVNIVSSLAVDALSGVVNQIFGECAATSATPGLICPN
ncbi:hypothetical protein PanWU01x14_200050, partial [Parasponia andersonii]